MNGVARCLALLAGVALGAPARGAPAAVVDIPTRPGVTQRFLYLAPERPQAAAILFAGGHGGLQLLPGGGMRWGAGNFLVRTREAFAENGIAVAVVDAPSDRQEAPFLSGFRQTPEHLADVVAVIAWLRGKTGLPVWLVGTSRGTQSAAWVATQADAAHGGPDGLVLTSTILSDKRGRPVPEMALQDVGVPVLVIHHAEDRCRSCAPGDLPLLMGGLSSAPRKELATFSGGEDRGDPCEAFAHHGFNGLEKEVVARIAAWIRQPAGK
jgi:hypothetical protein